MDKIHRFIEIGTWAVFVLNAIVVGVAFFVDGEPLSGWGWLLEAVLWPWAAAIWMGVARREREIHR